MLISVLSFIVPTITNYNWEHSINNLMIPIVLIGVTIYVIISIIIME